MATIYLTKTLITDLNSIPKPKWYNEQIGHWFLWLIQRKAMVCNWDLSVSERYLTPLYSKHLQRISHNYKQYFDLFLANNLIIKTGYCAGVSSSKYMLNKCYYDKSKHWIDITDKRLLKIINNSNNKLPDDTKRRLDIIRSNVSIVGNVRSLLSKYQPEQYSAFLAMCKLINDKAPHISKSKYGREYHTLCNLPKEVRKHIRINGEQIAEIDIPAAQPSFLYIWLLQNNIDKQEVEKYGNLIVENRFYEQIVEWWQQDYNETITRDQAKLITFKVFFDVERPEPKKRHQTNWHYQQLFARRFPLIYGVLKNKNMAPILQKMESDFVFDRCSILEDNNIPYFTIHDAVYLPKSMYKLYGGILDMFDVGVCPKLTDIPLYVSKNENAEKLITDWIAEKQERIKTAELYKKYAELCEIKGEKPLSNRVFGRTCAQYLTRKQVRLDGKRVWFYVFEHNRDGDTTNFDRDTKETTNRDGDTTNFDRNTNETTNRDGDTTNFDRNTNETTNRDGDTTNFDGDTKECETTNRDRDTKECETTNFDRDTKETTNRDRDSKEDMKTKINEKLTIETDDNGNVISMSFNPNGKRLTINDVDFDEFKSSVPEKFADWNVSDSDLELDVDGLLW